MRTSRIIIIVTAILIIATFVNGCVSTTEEIESESTISTMEPLVAPSSLATPTPETTPKATPKPTPIFTPVPTPMQTPFRTAEEKAGVLDKDMAGAPIMKNGLTLEDIAVFINTTEEDLLEAYGDDIECKRFIHTYKEFSYANLGINIVCVDSGFKQPLITRYIEIDQNQISFNGISKSTNFEQVMEILGDTEIVAIEDGLPDLYSYELRYRYNEIYVRIYSWDENGEGGIFISIVEKYKPEYRTIKISTEQIDAYFEMLKGEIRDLLGNGESFYNKEWINYKEYGIDFRFDEEGRVIVIRLDPNYQIGELMMGIELYEAREIMGKRKVEEHQTYEDGPIYYTRYAYKNFILQIVHFPYDGWWTSWDILSNEYAEDHLYSY